MSAYAYIHPKSSRDYASARLSMAARLNQVSLETHPGIHPWKDSSQYVEDKRDVQQIKSNMTLFPFSYDEDTVEADGSFSVKVSPKKEASPVSGYSIIRAKMLVLSFGANY